MTEFTQVISDGDYRKAIAKHYFGYKYTYISPILGLLLFLGLLITTIFLPDVFTETPIFLFLLAAFLLLRPILYIQNVFKSMKTSKFSSNETNIQITDDNKIITNTNGNTTSLNLADLYSYYDTNSFLFLYASRNQYLVLDKRQMNTKNVDNLIRTLDSLRIKKKK